MYDEDMPEEERIRALIELGINPVHVYEAKAQESGQPFVDLNQYTPEPGAINVVPPDVARRHNALPLKRENNVLYVALADLNNLAAADELRMRTRCQVRGVLAVPEQIEDAINKAYGTA